MAEGIQVPVAPILREVLPALGLPAGLVGLIVLAAGGRVVDVGGVLGAVEGILRSAFDRSRLTPEQWSEVERRRQAWVESGGHQQR